MEIDNDPFLKEHFYDQKRCLKCGSVDYEQELDEVGGYTVSCSKCPDTKDHH
jgi:formylmethanofuran dehydrogenase subunit E